MSCYCARELGLYEGIKCVVVPAECKECTLLTGDRETAEPLQGYSVIPKQSNLFCSSGTDARHAFQAAVKGLRLKTSYLSNLPVTSTSATTAFT